MFKSLAITLLIYPLAVFSQPVDDSEGGPLKFAFYSPSWGAGSGANLLAGLRLVVDNQTPRELRLQSIEFLSSSEGVDQVRINLDMVIPARGLAEKELGYRDLLSVNQCVSETLNESWRLVEISNYTLNPSVRRLIIEDTNAFRIYQCVSTVRTTWTDTDTGTLHSIDEWVLFHFESRQD